MQFVYNNCALDQFYQMRTRNQLVSFAKNHNSIQQILAQARSIAYPSKKIVSCSHMEICLPPTKINQHLKELLRLPSESNKKIEINKRVGSVLLEKGKKQQRLQSSLDIVYRNLSPNQQKGANRYELKDNQKRYENEVLHSPYKRQVYMKKAINLTELPSISIKANSKEITAKKQQIDKSVKRQFSTIDEKHQNYLSHQFLTQNKPLNTISHNQSINRSHESKEIYRKKLKSSIMLKKQEKRQFKLKLKFNKIRLHRQMIEDFPSEPQPWQADYKDFQMVQCQL